MPDFIFKGADKEQERGLEPVPGSGWPPEFIQKLRLSPESLRQPIISHMPEASRSGGNRTETWLLHSSVTSPRVVAVPWDTVPSKKPNATLPLYINPPQIPCLGLGPH